MNLIELYAACRRLQDHERVEGCDAAVIVHVSGGERRDVARVAADRDPERDCGVCGAM